MATSNREKLKELQTALEQIDAPYAKGFLRLEKLRKLCSTYLLGIRREVEGEYLHAFFGLHLVRSYRGQSDSPNLQNIPIRDPVQGCVIRPAFIPRPGHVLVEIDYSSLEVMIACALSGDKRLTYDAIEGDMHRDMAAECYLLDKDEVSKSVRSAAKGGFVFAEFYGDWYKQVAVNLWNDVKRGGFTTKNGTPLYDHLSGKGIVKRGLCEVGADSVLGTFEHHIRGVEHRFWNQRFRVYHAKRAAWIVQYNSQGYIDLVTGFRCMGPMTKNQVMNYHIQGPAFHCLLWSLITLMDEIRKRKMGAKVVAQIHDSIVADVPVTEVDDYLTLVQDITTKRLREHWGWITVPLCIEAEISEINWYEKKPVQLKGG